jgi:hypothetical protein
MAVGHGTSRVFGKCPTACPSCSPHRPIASCSSSRARKTLTGSPVSRSSPPATPAALVNG